MKQQEKTQLTRDKILSAAMEEFGANGYAGASLNNICAAGIAKGLLYHNFKNKDDLYLTCVGICFDALTRAIREAETGGDLKTYMSVRLRFFEEHKNETRIFFDAILQPPEALHKQIEALRSEFDALNSLLYGEVLSSVSLRKGILFEDALQYFTMLQTMFNGYFSSPFFQDLPLQEKVSLHEAKLAQALDFMLYGIAERRV